VIDGIAMRRCALALGISALLMGCAPPGTDDLIPLDRLLAPPRLWSPLLSPDGRQLSYVAIRNDAPNLFVAPVDDLAAARAVTNATGQGVTTSNVAGHVIYRWTPDGRRILYLQDESGNERWHLMSVEVASGEVRDLTPVEGAQVRLVAADAHEALVEINDRLAHRHDLYRIDFETAERQLVLLNERYIGFFADNDLRPRLAVASAPDGGFDIEVLRGGAWQPLTHLGQEDTSALIRTVEQGVGRFSPDNSSFLLYDSRGRDSWALLSIDLRTGDETVLAHDERTDLDSPIFDPATGELVAYRTNWTRGEWHALTQRAEEHLRRIQRTVDGDLRVIDRSADGIRWLVAGIRGNASPELYLYDEERREIHHLATLIPELEGLELPPVHPIVTRSSDGFPLVSYVLLPDGTDPDGDGVPARPLPTVVYVHGGPNDERAEYGYSARLQWLASRGYAVLDVNYRGSPGFGKRFLNAQNLEWGNAMHRDVVEQARRAVTEGIALPDAVGIFGGSYGGYEVLVAMTKTPDVFACGVDLAGPSDLESFIGIWWENFIPADNMAYKSTVLGDPATEKGREALRLSSPLAFAHQARNPILVFHGGQDSRVPTDQASRIVDRFVEHGVPVTYVVFPEEGHGVVRPDNRRAFYSMIEAFFGQCLGGRHDPITLHLDGADLEIPVGADRIPGLDTAWAAYRKSRHDRPDR
jgi:dipeptidyl aminopeptidase/acylaminoacyl peptidase